MSRRLALLIPVLAFAAVGACTSERPDPVFVGGEADGDGDTDGDADGDDGVQCDVEKYPCGPYGHQACDVIEDIRFVPAGEIAEAAAGEDGILSLSDIYADDSVLGILLFGTAGWCGACAAEAVELNAMRADLQDVDGAGGRIEFVAVVFQDDYFAPATREYAESYGRRYDFEFPTVADSAGDVLYYFDAQSSPGNVMIDATLMRIQRVIQGFDPAAIVGVLNTLDGSVNCR